MVICTLILSADVPRSMMAPVQSRSQAGAAIGMPATVVGSDTVHIFGLIPTAQVLSLMIALKLTYRHGCTARMEDK